MFRDITERDYGIDGLVELFEDGMPTGQIALVQIKGTQKTIVPLQKEPDHISCRISSSNANYALQRNIPVLLIYVQVDTASCFYYARLQDQISEKHIRKMAEQDSITVLIPAENHSVVGINRLIDLIKQYYGLRRE